MQEYRNLIFFIILILIIFQMYETNMEITFTSAVFFDILTNWAILGSHSAETSMS